jgi:DUF4097 and DUF4098 domain-containing protein YvlB
MRPFTPFGIVLLFVAPAALAAEVTKSLTVRLSGDPKIPFAVENLAGEMRVVPGTGDAVVATATVHAETDAALALVRFEQVVGAKGIPTLRVRYPVDQYTTFHYPRRKADSSLLGRLFDGSSSESEYDGVRVRVSSGRGVLLYADVEVQVPTGASSGTFQDSVGMLSGRGLEGRFRFDSSDGGISLDQLKGETSADTGSGDVKARGLSGSFSCDTGSGECEVTDFQGESLRLNTGSGELRVASSSAARIRADTGSGDVHLQDVDAEDIRGDLGSGDLQLDTRGHRLKHVKADTGSGNVILRLDPDAGFRVRASMSSGALKCRFADARPLKNDDEIVGYDRGDGALQIGVDTGSGDVVVEPRAASHR